MPTALPTSARDETVPAQAQVEPEVATDNARAYLISDRASVSLRDNTAGKGDSQHADDIAAVAGSSQTILRSNAEPDPDRTRADIETNTGGQQQAAKAEERALD